MNLLCTSLQSDDTRTSLFCMTLSKIVEPITKLTPSYVKLTRRIQDHIQRGFALGGFESHIPIHLAFVFGWKLGSGFSLLLIHPPPASHWEKGLSYWLLVLNSTYKTPPPHTQVSAPLGFSLFAPFHFPLSAVLSVPVVLHSAICGRGVSAQVRIEMALNSEGG